jgi:hypothetical protein
MRIEGVLSCRDEGERGYRDEGVATSCAVDGENVDDGVGLRASAFLRPARAAFISGVSANEEAAWGMGQPDDDAGGPVGDGGLEGGGTKAGDRTEGALADGSAEEWPGGRVIDGAVDSSDEGDAEVDAADDAAGGRARGPPTVIAGRGVTLGGGATGTSNPS